MITLYSQKGASPVSQRQWPLNLVGIWVRVKRPHLFFQVNCRSNDHIIYEKRLVSTDARPQNSAGDINHRKTHKSKAFLLFKRYYHLIHINMHHFKDIQTVYVNSLPYCFYYIYSGIAWGHYQWISKLLIQIALCEHVYDNGTQIVKPKF